MRSLASTHSLRMHRRIFVAAILCAAVLGLAAQTPSLAQTAQIEDVWNADRAFERAITSKQNDTARSMFHPDFLGVDADGSTYTAEAYFVRRGAESLFFDVQDETHPGGGIAFGTVLIGSSVHRFSHVWLQTPQGLRLVAAQASPIGDLSARAPVGATRASGGDETTFITDHSKRTAAETAVVDALRGLVRAEHASDVKGWAALTDDHFWLISPDGQQYRKGVRMAQIGRATPTGTSALPTIPEMRIRFYGDLAIMRTIQEPVRPPSMRGTRLWVRHGDTWQQALNHQTFIMELSRK